MERKTEFKKDWYITWEAGNALGLSAHLFRKAVKKYGDYLETKNKGRTTYYSKESLEFLSTVLKEPDKEIIKVKKTNRYKYCKICGAELNTIAKTIGYCSNCDKFFKKDRELVYMKDGTPVVL